MFGVKQPGPGKGDRVQVESLGTVIEFEERAGVDGALVELDGDDDHQVWVPLKFLMAAGRH
jgi:hypothetical protein